VHPIPAEIRARILDRARGRCERCGLAHGAHGVRLKASDVFIELKDAKDWKWAERNGHRPVQIAIEVARIHDQAALAVDPSNLMALCQKCLGILAGPAPGSTRGPRLLEDRRQGDLFAVPGLDSPRMGADQELSVEHEGHELGTTEVQDRREGQCHLRAVSNNRTE
jgi:hypothetical protein